MPTKTAASYNLGKPMYSRNIYNFEKRNPPKFIQQQIIAQQLKERLENEARILKITQQTNKSRLIILHDVEYYDNNSMDFINLIKDEYSVVPFSFAFYNGSKELLNTLESQYNLGYRFFASTTINSNSLVNICFPFFKNHKDTILANTNSTLYFEPGILPYNILRSSVHDKELIKYIINDILYNLNILGEQNILYSEPINGSKEYNKPIFEKIVYIYTATNSNGDVDLYSQGYGEQLYNKIEDDKKVGNNLITFESYKITDDDLTLPQKVKDLLSDNTVSNVNFSINPKTMFILNSLSPEKILNLFDEEYMYDNYFIFGDSFIDKHYTSKYKFNYAIIPIGNYSYDGFKVCNSLPDNKGTYISPFLYAVSDIKNKMLQSYTSVILSNPNLPTEIILPNFINALKRKKFIIEDNYYYERKIFTYYVDTKDGDVTNAQYNTHLFFKYSFNPSTSGVFKEKDDIIQILEDDNVETNSITLLEFGWNSRNSIVNELFDNGIPKSIIFFNTDNLLNWKTSLDISVLGNRNNSLIQGYKKHTPLFFEYWRSHDERFNIMFIDVNYELIMDYSISKVYNINKTIEITRKCYKDAGINGNIPENNFLYDEQDEIDIDFDTEEITPINYTNYVILQYFKGTRYTKSFNGLSTDYLAPVIININIVPIIVYEKYKITDLVVSKEKNILGKVVSVSDDYQEINVQPYSTIYAETNDGYYIKINKELQPVICNQINTILYSKLNPINVIDYTNWSIFTKNMFIRSTFMDSIIDSDTKQNDIMSYSEFGGDSRTNISQPIKETVSLTFSTYDNWIKWKNKMNISKENNELHTEIFWEMYRSNKFQFIEKSIDVKLIMNNNETQIYNINEYVEFERKIYLDFNTYDTSETLILSINFKTSDIVPSDIINKPIMYIEYFVGDKYITSYNGVLEAYFSPVLIQVNIIPTIIYNVYKINDYVNYHDKINNMDVISKVTAVSSDNTIIEIVKYDTVLNNDNIFYIKTSGEMYNVSQDDISLFNKLNDKIIININDIGNLKSGNNIDIKTIDGTILEDLYNENSNYMSFFNTYYSTEVVEEFKNDFYLTFTNLDFNNWKNALNDEYFKENNHTRLFFELCRSQGDLIQPIYTNIEYELIMNDSKADNYTIIKTLNLSRNIIDENYDIVSNENFSFELNFNTQKIVSSDILNKPITYVSYFKGNKYLKYNELTDYYSPLIITINVLPKNIYNEIILNEFVSYKNNIYKIIFIGENYDSIQLQKYSVTKPLYNNRIYVQSTTTTIQLSEYEDILPLKRYYEVVIIDQSEWGSFVTDNLIKIDKNIDTEIIIPDSTSFGNIDLNTFNLNKQVFTGIKDNFYIIMQNENVFNNFKKLINSSITFDQLNHTPLFFEIWRSHSDYIIPLTIEMDYNLIMTPTPSIYSIVKNISFVRNIYNVIGQKEDDFISTENDNLNIDIKTEQITSNDILNSPIFFVYYFKGHKYLHSFTNITEVYYSPIILKINVIPYVKDTIPELIII